MFPLMSFIVRIEVISGSEAWGVSDYVLDVRLEFIISILFVWFLETNSFSIG